MAKLNSQPKADITLLFLNFSVCVVSPLWWLNTCLNQWNIPLSLFLAPENKFSDQAVQMWINEHPTSTLSHHYPIRICRCKDIFFFYRQLLSVMNKNVLRILPRSVVGGLKKKRAEQSSSIDSVCIPLVVSLWQHQRLWVCGRSLLALLQPRRDPPSLLSSALSMSLCVHFQASHSLLYHPHRDNTAVQKAARSSLPPSLPPSLTPCLLVHLPLSVFLKDVTASLSL